MYHCKIVTMNRYVIHKRCSFFLSRDLDSGDQAEDVIEVSEEEQDDSYDADALKEHAEDEREATPEPDRQPGGNQLLDIEDNKSPVTETAVLEKTQNQFYESIIEKLNREYEEDNQETADDVATILDGIISAKERPAAVMRPPPPLCETRKAKVGTPILATVNPSRDSVVEEYYVKCDECLARTFRARSQAGRSPYLCIPCLGAITGHSECELEVCEVCDDICRDAYEREAAEEQMKSVSSPVTSIMPRSKIRPDYDTMSPLLRQPDIESEDNRYGDNNLCHQCQVAPTDRGDLCSRCTQEQDCKRREYRSIVNNTTLESSTTLNCGLDSTLAAGGASSRRQPLDFNCVQCNPQLLCTPGDRHLCTDCNGGHEVRTHVTKCSATPSVLHI